MGPIAAALRLANYTGEFGASDGFFNLETISTYAAQLDGTWVASSLPPINKIPSATSLITDFQREVGPITLFSQYGYAAAQLVISAAQQAGAASRTNVLRSLQRGGSYTTLAGQFSFSYSGDPLIPNIYLYVVGKDGFRYLRPAVRTGFRSVNRSPLSAGIATSSRRSTNCKRHEPRTSEHCVPKSCIV